MTARAFAVMPFVWSVGTILGPSIGGYFASPADHLSGVSKDGIFGRFPYLLPNLICAALMFASVIAGYFLLDETHPDMQPWSTPTDLANTVAESPLIPAQASDMTAPADLTHESYGTFNKVKADQEENWRVDDHGRPVADIASPEQTIYSRRVIMLVIALGIFTYVSMCFDHLTPIFFQDDRVGDVSMASLSPMAGGLGLSVQAVGIIMSINGLIALFVQGVVFPIAASWLGVWRLFIVVTTLHPLAFVVVPYITLLPENLTYLGIYACLTFRNLLSILAYPLLLILIKEAAPSPKCLGKINGLAASTAAACRCLASPIAGLLYGIGMQMDFVAIAWWGSALVALLGTVQAFCIDRRKNTEHHQVTARTPCRLVPKRWSKKDVVHVHVREVPEQVETEGERRPLIAA